MTTLFKPTPLTILSALLFAAALMFIWSPLAWIFLIPVLTVLQNRKGRQAFSTGALFGLAIGMVVFYWLISVVRHFTGGSILYGILTYSVACIFLALWFGLLFLCFDKLKRPGYSWWNAFLIAALWTGSEWLFATALPGMPWMAYHAGNFLLDNLYAIQPATAGGVYLLSFIVVFVNYLAAHFLVQQKWKMLSIPLGLILVHMIAGYILCTSFQAGQDTLKGRQEVSVAILCENTEPDEKWDKQNGNLLVKRLLDLNYKAVALKPELAVWTESAVPWTYHADDDFVKEVMKITGPSGITHIMGINTDYQENVVYNSAYSLLPDGRVAGRYDKRFLLDLVERPVAFFSLPFLSTDGFYAEAGDKADPLPTPYGKAGVLICNEALVPGVATELVHNGAGFLVNISNDGWFSHIPYLVKQHFYNARLRAVEVRKDMVINSNLGISGMVNASGQIETALSASERYVKKVTLHPNHYITLYTSTSSLFLYFTALIIVLFPITKLFLRNKNQ